MRSSLAVMVLLMICGQGIAGDLKYVRAAEDTLKVLFRSLALHENQRECDSVNKRIVNTLERALWFDESFDYPFDSLPLLGKVTAPDSLLRVFTWNCSGSPSDHKYFGFLQLREEAGGNVSVTCLNQTGYSGDNFDNEEFSCGDWYGALYYQIIPVIHNEQTIYTLIGFDFNSPFTNIKLIDALIFIDNSPVLGTPVFQIRDEIKHRVVFEFSSQVVMLLRYVPEMNMIVHDHLAPSSPRLKGSYRYYGPDFSYDGFRFLNGKWVHLPDIDWRK